MASMKDVVAHAMTLHQKGDEDGAAAVFEKILTAAPNEPLALEYLGMRATKKGDYATAISLFRQAVAQEKCRPAVRLQLAHAIRDSGQLTDSVDTYRLYVTETSDPIGAVALAEVLFELDREQDAESILRQALEWKPDHLKALCLLARACDALEKRTDAEELRTTAIESEESTKLSSLMKATAHLDLGNPEKAFSTAPEGVNSLYGEALDAACVALDFATLPAVQGSLPSAMGVPLIVASGDPAYVQRYGPDLIRSVGANSPSTDVHIHVVVPGDDQPPALPGDLPTYSLSWENDSKANRTTFSTRRFVRAAALMRTLDRPLVLIDIDSLVKKDVAAAKSSLPEFDIAMRYRTEEILLNQRVCGGFLALTPSPEAQTFIDAVAAYILHFEEAGTATWSLDQMALLAARSRFSGEDTNPAVRITDVPERFLDWRRHSADSVLWTTKGAGKALPKK